LELPLVLAAKSRSGEEPVQKIEKKYIIITIPLLIFVLWKEQEEREEQEGKFCFMLLCSFFISRIIYT